MLEQLQGLLTADELERANRFVFFKDRSSFIVARSALRLILARYLDEDPRRLRFAYGPQGKPELAANASKLFFNISHSGDRIMIAVASSFDVGVDIEKIDIELASEPMTGVFSRIEQLALAGIRDDKRLQAFFKCWTSKEAYIKGIGEGLNAVLEDFDVCVDPDKPAELLRSLDRDGSDWFLHRIDGDDAYAATLATMSHNSRPILFDDWHGFVRNALSISPDVEIKGAG
jgi:4'-phosphopantetheinyl transferase